MALMHTPMHMWIPQGRAIHRAVATHVRMDRTCSTVLRYPGPRAREMDDVIARTWQMKAVVGVGRVELAADAFRV